MPRRPYIIAFVLLAVLFVPVYLFFLVGYDIRPCVLSLLGLVLGVGDIIHGFSIAPLSIKIMNGLVMLYLLGCIALYIYLFYLAARLTFWISTLASKKILQITAQIIALSLIFSCSFLNIINSGDIDSPPTAPQTFWEAWAPYLRLAAHQE
jgi:hypothetical protein